MELQGHIMVRVVLGDELPIMIDKIFICIQLISFVNISVFYIGVLKHFKQIKTANQQLFQSNRWKHTKRKLSYVERVGSCWIVCYGSDQSYTVSCLTHKQNLDKLQNQW